MRTFVLADKLTIADVVKIACQNYSLKLSPSHKKKISTGAKIIRGILTSGKKVYGLTTGLGSLELLRN